MNWTKKPFGNLGVFVFAWIWATFGATGLDAAVRRQAVYRQRGIVQTKGPGPLGGISLEPAGGLGKLTPAASGSPIIQAAVSQGGGAQAQVFGAMDAIEFFSDAPADSEGVPWTDAVEVLQQRITSDEGVLIRSPEIHYSPGGGLNVPEGGLIASDGALTAVFERTTVLSGGLDSLPLEDLFGMADVLLLGEDHASGSSHGFIKGNLNRFRSLGVRRIGFEGLMFEQQGRVSDYVHSRRRFLGRRTIGGARKGHVEGLLKAVRELNQSNGDPAVGVAALGIPMEAVQDLVLQEVARRGRSSVDAARGKHGGILEFETGLKELEGELERRYIPGLNESVATVFATLRNIFMAQRLTQGLAPGEKAVALVGGFHVDQPSEITPYLYGMNLRDFGTLPDELARLGRNAFSLSLIAGASVAPHISLNQVNNFLPLYKLVWSALSEITPGFLRTGENTGIYHFAEPLPQDLF